MLKQKKYVLIVSFNLQLSKVFPNALIGNNILMKISLIAVMIAMEMMRKNLVLRVVKRKVRMLLRKKAIILYRAKLKKA